MLAFTITVTLPEFAFYLVLAVVLGMLLQALLCPEWPEKVISWLDRLLGPESDSQSPPRRPLPDPPSHITVVRRPSHLEPDGDDAR